MARTPQRVDVAAIAAAMPDFDEEIALTLRQMGVRDPLPGAPLRVQIGREPDEVAEIEPGKWDEEGFGERKTGLPPGCPVIPLGKDGEVCYFLDTMGGVFALDARSSGKGPIGYLFAGRSRYLEWAWPRWSRGSKARPREVIGWDADNARQCLVDACAFVGYFALEDQVRGRGAWRDELGGGLIYHAGDAVYIDATWKAPGVHGGLIYPARMRIGRPSLRRQPARSGPGDVGPGDQLLEVLETFNWDRPIDARLMLGWVITAKMGGALERRPVGFVVGGEGSGKSTLQWVLRGVMNGALIKTSNTTQAGIYQRLQQDSIAILVDELEAKDDTRTTDKILELARITYSGDTMQRGGKDGVGKEFQLHSSFLGSSINKPATDAQDDSRMFVATLREREAAGGKLTVTPAELDAIGRHLLRRIFDGWAAWPQLLETFRGALIGAGHNDRACDTFAPLAAGCHLALHDEPPSAAQLAEWGGWLKPEALEEIAERQRTWERCFEQLLGAQPDAFRQSHHKTLGALLADYKRDPGGRVGDLEAKLPEIGLAVSWPDDDPMKPYATARLFIPTTSPSVHALLAETAWAGRMGAKGPWNGALRQAPKELWENGSCEKGFPKKVKGLFLHLQKVLEA